MAARRRNPGLFLAAAWLLANCTVVALWPGSVMDWFPFACLAMLAWPCAALAVLVAPFLWTSQARQRWIAVVLGIIGSVVGWEAPWLGRLFHVWWREDVYMSHVRAALADPPPRGSCGPGWIEVDPSDVPPRRAAIFTFGAHGDVDGFVYDPTGRVAEGRQEWLYGAYARHLYGPWYAF
jgi:hypothetical protein